MSQKTKHEQLGMNASTANGRLLKDILWKLIQETNQTKCFVCGEEMSRETFTIEHKIPWLDSKTPKELFFDLSNISFSHAKCNNPRRGMRKTTTHGLTMYDDYGCRCDICKKAKSDMNKKHLKKRKRPSRYVKVSMRDGQK